MKQHLFVVSAALILGISGNALAACSGTQVIDGPGTGSGNKNLTALVSGNTICASQGGDSWQEQHRAGGQLWDYKLGNGHPVDPTEQVGTWSVSGSQLTHAYTNGPSFNYTVWVSTAAGFTHTLCGAQTIEAKIKTGITNCP